MELILLGIFGGIALALILARVIFVVVSRAVHNLITWAIYNFGNDEALHRMREQDDGD